MCPVLGTDRAQPRGSYEFLLDDHIQGMLMQHWWLHDNAIETEAPTVLEAIERVTRLLRQQER